MDAATLALAAGLIQELRLGADASPDVLSIGLSATDYVGHAFGTGGQEMCLQLLSVDRDLGDFLRLLDRQRLDYAVVLTSDHGQPDIPERLRLKGIAQAARADAALSSGALGKALGAKLGLAGPVLLGDLGADVYIDQSLGAADRSRVEREALAYYQAHPQVAAVFTARQLRAMRMPRGRPDRWTLAERVRASFDPQRSGDIYVALKEFIMPIPSPGAGYVATHGSPWDYDRRVPILFWRSGAAGANRQEPVSTVDILPTLTAMYGLAQPRGSDGACLAAIPGILCPRR
jgi:arylsulfatase A-like enzyme